jgi:hypothetical protein
MNGSDFPIRKGATFSSHKGPSDKPYKPDEWVYQKKEKEEREKFEGNKFVWKSEAVEPQSLGVRSKEGSRRSNQNNNFTVIEKYDGIKGKFLYQSKENSIAQTNTIIDARRKGEITPEKEKLGKLASIIRSNPQKRLS